MVQAQNIKQFSFDPELVVKEMTTFFESASKAHKETVEQTVKDFPLFWTSISDQEQLGFIEIANAMLGRKMSPVPYFSEFIKTFKVMSTSNQSAKSYTAFIRSIKYCVENTTTNQYLNVLETYRNILEHNMFNTFTGNTRWWAKDASSYYFDFDTVPKVVFPKVKIVAENGKDSIVIKNTSGYFSPIRSVFVGTKGVVDWQKAGSNDVYVSFEKYTISTRTLRIEIRDVRYHNPNYFSESLQGVFEDRVMTTEVGEETTTYPRFTSYKKDIKINNLYHEVSYQGGIYVRGSRFMGQGDAENLASLIFSKEGQPVIKIKAASMVLRKDQASGSLCNMTVFLDKDSIFHSAVQMKYIADNREIWLSRGKDGSERMPFFNTYHQLEMFAEAIHWKLNEANIEFGALPGPGGQTNAVFESFDYFTRRRVERMQANSEVNPLHTLYEYFRVNKVKTATLDEIVRHFGYAKTDVQSLIFEFVEFGFVDFNVLTNEITYRQKLGNYLLNEVNRKDYDILEFRSVISGNKSNASLSLLNYDLTVNGIELVVLSEEQIVNIAPKGGQITIQKNRDFLFHGNVIAGLFDFWVSNAKFNYNQFTMDFPVIDSIVFYVEDKRYEANMRGEYPLQRVRSYVQDISGILHIDQSNNKSGRLDVSGYPYFESKSPGKVYYDHPFVYNGVYDRERFYFAADQFTIRDLDDFDTDSLLFDGYLYSGGIFPDIVKPLKVRPDFSLGFVDETGNDGFPAYEGRGIFTGKIDLSNLGLRCTGTLDYAQSHGEGKNMLFFLDSMNGMFDAYKIEAQQSGTQYPPVTAKNTYAHWEPHSDKMYVNNTNSLFRMYDRSTLDGQLIVSYGGVEGSGKFRYNIAEMTGKNYTFLHHELRDPALDIVLYDTLSDDYHFKATNHKAYLDLDKGRGNFIANEGVVSIVFPINMFATHSKEFDWLVAENRLDFRYEDPYANTDFANTEIKDLYEMRSHGNELISIHPAQDSLRFTTSKASYDFKKYEITAEGVRFIEVADAAIFPHQGIVKIYRRAEIARLDNSKVLANINTKFHELFKAGINIGSRKTYNGSGYCNYVNELKQKQEILFDSIWVNHSLQSRASGKIAIEKEFTLNPHFGYFGDVFLHAEEEFLSYRGGVILLYACDTAGYAPIRFSGAVNPDSVLIPIDEKTKDMNNRPVSAAIVSAAQGGQIYTAFGRSKNGLNDLEYISAQGYLTFHKETGKYIVTSREKIDDLELDGNIVSLDKKNCIAEGEGKLDLGTNMGRVQFTPIGNVVNYIQQDSAAIKIAVVIDFILAEGAMGVMADYIESSYSLQGIDILEMRHYQTALKELLGNTEYQKIYPELAQYYSFARLPNALKFSLLIADIDMAWSYDDRAFVCNGNIGIAICGATEVNKYVPGIVEVKKTGSGKSAKTTMQMYFETGDDWFYFQYSGTTMQALSSVKGFNDLIDNTPSEKRTFKANPQKSLAKYSYRKAALGTKKRFVTKYTPEDTAN
jgi:hypothetical protein